MENQSKSPRQMSLMQLIKAAVKISDKKFGVGKASVCVSHEIWRHGSLNGEAISYANYKICAFSNDNNIYFQKTSANSNTLFSDFKKATDNLVV